MRPVFLLLGSNLGNRLANLQEARLHISRTLGNIITVSAIYKTAAWGNENQPEFYNQVIELDANVNAHTALLNIHQIEKSMGRVREERWGSRLIDIDILLWNTLVISESDLTIPHIQLPNRRFALVPLVELVPDFTHPVLNKSMQLLLNECSDSLAVTKLDL